MATYNGHESWNAWNVALWIGNDEPTYLFALDCVRRPRKDGKTVSAKCAALRFLAGGFDGGKTPDGARWSFRSVTLAMAEYVDEERAASSPAPRAPVGGAS